MKLNLNEVFEAAKQIERSGYKFYSNAAKRIPEHRDFLIFLANEEVGHEAVFSELQKLAISNDFQDSVWNPDNIISQYFESLAESTVFKRNTKELDELYDSSNSIEDIIDWAIKREQDSVLFFIGLKESLKESSEKEKIEDIISEEIKHIHLLMDKKSKLL